jgi:hypothetical protein
VVQGTSIILNFEFSILNSRTPGPKTGAGFWVLDPPPHPERVNHRAAFNSKSKIQNSKLKHEFAFSHGCDTPPRMMGTIDA